MFNLEQLNAGTGVHYVCTLVLCSGVELMKSSLLGLPGNEDAMQFVVQSLRKIQQQLRHHATQPNTPGIDHSDPKVSIVAALLDFHKCNPKDFGEMFVVVDAAKRNITPGQTVLALTTLCTTSHVYV